MRNTKGVGSNKALYTLLGAALIVLLWAAAGWAFGADIIPPPWLTVYDTLSLLLRPSSWLQLAITVARVIAGFVLALVVGTVAGVATARREVEALLSPAVLLLQGVPPILWTIPLILILGFSRLTPVLVIALICLPLVTLNVSEGTKSVSRSLREMLSVFAPGFLPRLRELILPHLKPFFAAALRLGLTLGIKASVVAEYFSANDGIGFQIQAAYQAFQVRRLFAWALMLVLLIVLFDRILSASVQALQKVRPGGPARLPEAFSPMELQRLQQLQEQKRVGFAGSRPAAVEVEGVSFGYPGAEPVLEECTFSVAPGQIAVISGDSGVGKSTLLKLIASLLVPDSGRILRPEGVGFVFQDDRFLPWRSILANVSLTLRHRGIPRHRASRISASLLKEVGLGGRELAAPEELSGGMKKRLALARCFAAAPEVVLMDEPFSGLHRSARAALWSKLGELLRLRTAATIIVTHYPEEVPDQLRCIFFTLTGNPARLQMCS